MTRLALLRIVTLSAAAVVFLSLRPWRIDCWRTSDQQAQALFDAGRFREAAPLFTDPLHQGVAWRRAGDFKAAAAAFARDGSAEGAFDQGVALIFLGKYDEAIRRFDRALVLRPGWTFAIENRAIAEARRRKPAGDGEEGTDGEVKPDSIVFDGQPKKGGDEVQTDGGRPMSDEQLRSMWLRQVQTKPADFLRARFAAQQEKEGAAP